METSTTTNSDFLEAVANGFADIPKHISSKYFYDEIGDKLFQSIMRMPEYYLTGCEYEILKSHKNSILDAIAPDENGFDLIEFGAGDGMKTNVLLEHFMQKRVDFRFVPIDISGSVLQHLEEKVKKKFSQIDMVTINDEYFSALASLNDLSDRRKVILFLGSNIGNFTESEAVDFLSAIHKSLNPGDRLLTGFDLKKDPKRILAAYNDPYGYTRAFNLNLLYRINKELGGQFDIQNFEHYPLYDPESGAAKSFLVSNTQHDVWIEALQQSIHFDQWELIFTEISQKYDIKDIHRLAEMSGFSVQKDYYDCKHFYVDSLWKK
jgi:dimethylhistidine N-methyltransferase